ncbi:transketolase [Deinobacterium chartae]|uniref:Transketolase n=1 Tax=Deinobacterium chartae TaxID=521158 RepID=A0A841I3H8_9DEIO|nr:transketolase [Deinobacterium chartae]MBB6098928.1 transketolase [Deinobacterium chartae]
MSLETLAINTIRTLSIDAVQKANSGHPGAPLGMAPTAYVLWTKFLRHNPKNPRWMGRDRYVLSAGHASMLIYSMLHLTGYDLSLEELKRFRQWGSKTPGHPEYGLTPGLEMTTGPLGQGAATSVGMAMAEAHLAARFNRPGLEVFNNFTYAMVSDGDLMEGVSHEAASLAGHLKLGKLIWLYDDNDVSLDAATNVSFSDETTERFQGYGWQVLMVSDGNDTTALQMAIRDAQQNTNQPTLIRIKTIIGYGSPNKAGTHKAHGEPLGEEEVRLTKQLLGWEYEEPFTVPDEVREHFLEAVERGRQQEQEWNALLERYRSEYPEEAAALEAQLSGKLPAGWAENLPSFEAGGKAQATRAASGTVLNAIAARVPALVGGSADLAGSTKTTIDGEAFSQAGNLAGRNIYFGVREHGMAAAANGMALYGGLRPYVGTFLVFSDYLKPSLRLAALMEQPVIYVFTHDSIGLGEDGPTHQPIEHLAALRAVPHLAVFRPADANETAAAWQIALERTAAPTALVLTRQNLPVLPRNHQGVRRGAYVVRDAENHQIVLIASGSEVHLALRAAETLEAEGIPARVVSMPSMELFREQEAAYKSSVLTPGVKRVAIEAASPFGWHEWVGDGGAVIAMRGFGASAPAETLFEKFGFNVENVVRTVKGLL